MIQRFLVVLVLALSGVAHAQPGVTPQTMTYQQPPPIQLTPEEQDILSTGYITTGMYIGGALATLFVGFGAGQAVEGRWHDTGWIFTLGEPVAFAVTFYGLIEMTTTCDRPGASCNTSGTTFAVGMIALVGLRLWEIIDTFVGPSRHNERYNALQLKLGNAPQYGMRPFVAPTASGGAIAGFTLRF